MNIIWNVMMPLTPACGSLSVRVDPNDQWQGVKLTGAKQRALKGIFTADIIHNNKVFKNIPRHWYMVEN